MITRWLPKDRILKQALYSLITCIVLALVAAGLGAYDLSRTGWPERGRKDVAEAVWQYGVTSQQAGDAVRQLSQSAGPNTLIALIDPATGKAVAGSPADLVGKKPEEMALPSGAKLPALDRLLGREHFQLRTAANTDSDLTVRVTPLYPETRGAAQDGALGWRSNGDGWRGAGRRGEGRRSFQGQQPQAPTPDAVLLVVGPEPAVTPLAIAAGVAGALAVVAFVLYWLSIAWWVFADARRRGGRAFAWGVLALLTNLVGAAVYLVARREQRTCPACGATVERSFNHCPHCGHALKHTCQSCGHDLRPGWTHCANCGAPYEGPAE